MMNLQLIDFSIADHVLFFLLAILLPILSILSSFNVSETTFDRETKINLYYSNGFFLWIMASIVLTTWNYMDRSFEDLGFRWPILSNQVYILVVLFVFLYAIDLTLQYIFEKNTKRKVGEWNKNTQFLPSSFNEYKHYSFLAFSAGICEEILFRGFLIHYLVSIFGSGRPAFLFALLVPALLFSAGHLYQGKWAMLKIFFGAIILGLIYLASASLLLVVGLHVAVDLISAIYAYFVSSDAYEINDSNESTDSLEQENL